MPPSLLRHNLARLRIQLELTQADLAEIAGCSPATIRAVEIGKLALSEGLAARICQALDFWDKDWLLKNDLNSPVPPILQNRSLDEDTYTWLLNELFCLLFTAVAKLDRTRGRLMIELSAAIQLDALRKDHAPKPDAEVKFFAMPADIQYLIKNPQILDPRLRECINLKGLLKLYGRSNPPQPEEKASPKPLRSRSQSQVLPSRDGQRKNRLSS